MPYDGKYDYILKLFHRWWQNFSDDDLYFLMFCIISAGYFNTTDIYEHVILYENLSEDPEMELTRIFKVMGIPMKHLPAALGALKSDSQKGTFGSRGQGRSLKLPPESLAGLDKYLGEFNLPMKHNTSAEEFKKLYKCVDM